MTDPIDLGVATAAHGWLSAYALAAWPGFALHPLHRRIVAALEAVESGQCDRLMIFAPPRHGKTLLASWIFPAWFLGRRPDRQVIAVTYSQERADDSGRRVRALLEDPIARDIFPALAVDERSRAAHRFDLGIVAPDDRARAAEATLAGATVAGGAYRAVGIGGPITGRGADLLLIDDPIKDAEQAESALYRRKIRRWYRWVAYPRIQRGGAVVLIMTRWHEDDLAGWLLAEGREGDRWDVLSLPALADDGAPVCPELFDGAALGRIRTTIGERAWLSLYQQRPTPPEGTIFRRAWWRYFDLDDAMRAELGLAGCRVIQAWDLKLKDTRAEGTSYVCGQVWAALQRGGYYLLDVVRRRCGFTETLAEIAAATDRWPSTQAILVEEAAAGPAAIEVLRRRYPHVVAVPPRGSKEQRAQAVAPMVEAGSVHVRRAAWTEAFVEECAAFPRAEHDDQVDAMAHALRRLAADDASVLAAPDASMVGMDWTGIIGR